MSSLLLCLPGVPWTDTPGRATQLPPAPSALPRQSRLYPPSSLPVSWHAKLHCPAPQSLGSLVCTAIQTTRPYERQLQPGRMEGPDPAGGGRAARKRPPAASRGRGEEQEEGQNQGPLGKFGFRHLGMHNTLSRALAAAAKKSSTFDERLEVSATLKQCASDSRRFWSPASPGPACHAAPAAGALVAEHKGRLPTLPPPRGAAPGGRRVPRGGASPPAGGRVAGSAAARRGPVGQRPWRCSRASSCAGSAGAAAWPPAAAEGLAARGCGAAASRSRSSAAAAARAARKAGPGSPAAEGAFWGDRGLQQCQVQPGTAPAAPCHRLALLLRQAPPHLLRPAEAPLHLPAPQGP